MSEENKQLVRRWFEEVWNNGRVEAIDEMFDENGIAHGLSDDPENPIRGPQGFRPFHTVFRDAFPNMMIVVEDGVAEGDKVAARCSVRAKHEGEFMRQVDEGNMDRTVVLLSNDKTVKLRDLLPHAWDEVLQSKS